MTNTAAVILAIALVSCTAMFTRAQPAPTTATKRIDQRCDKVIGGKFTETARTLGADGWELVTMSTFEYPKSSLQAYSYNVDVHFVMCFKREVPTY